MSSSKRTVAKEEESARGRGQERKKREKRREKGREASGSKRRAAASRVQSQMGAKTSACHRHLQPCSHAAMQPCRHRHTAIQPHAAPHSRYGAVSSAAALPRLRPDADRWPLALAACRLAHVRLALLPLAAPCLVYLWVGFGGLIPPCTPPRPLPLPLPLPLFHTIESRQRLPKHPATYARDHLLVASDMHSSTLQSV